MKFPLILAILASIFHTGAQCSCAHGTSLVRRVEGVTEAPKFGYEGLQGPLNWAALSSANSLCNTGTSQSPIDLVSGNITVDSGAAYALSIPDTTGSEFENLGTTVEVLVNGTMASALGDYKMAQFHFHTPSEHHINGQYFPMETHFVFEKEDKSIAVVSFLIELGTAADPLLGAVLPTVSRIRKVGEAATTPPLTFGALQAHLAANTVFRYIGSLTTPPCSQGVDWIISSKPLIIDDASFQAAKSVVGFNSRFSQGEIGQQNLLQISVAEALTKAAGGVTTPAITAE